LNVTSTGIGVGSLAALVMAGVVAAAAAPPEAGRGQRLENRFEVGAPFPEVALPSLDDGTPTTMAAFRGEKVILHVFASW